MNKETQLPFIFFIILLLGYFSQYHLNAFLAQNSSAILYGDFGITLKILAITVSLSLFGTDSSTEYFISKYLLSGQKIKTKKFIIWNIALLRRTFLFFLIVSITIFFISDSLLMLGLRNIHHYHFVIYILWITPFAASFRLLTMLLRGLNLNVYASLSSNLLIYTVQFIFFFILIKFITSHLDHFLIISILGLSSAILTVIIFYTLTPKIRNIILLEVKQSTKINIKNTSWYKQSIKLMSNNIIYLIIMSLDLFIVKLASKNTSDIGHYTAVLAITYLLWLIPGNMYQNIQSNMSYLLTTASGKLDLESRLCKVNRVVFSLLSISSGLIICFSTELLQFFGSSYVQAKYTLIFTTIAVWFAGITQSSMLVLIYSGLSLKVTKINIIKLIVMFLLITPVTYIFGITGTAISMLIIVLIFQIYFVFLAKKETGVRTLLILK